MLRLQAGHVTGWGSKDLRMLDHFQMGPNLVRGFADRRHRSARHDARARRSDALGGTMYWGASFEMQFPVVRRAEGLRHQARGVRGCGFGVGLRGQTFFPNAGQTVTTIDPVTGKDTNDMTVRSSIGAGIIWDSPFGPIRIDYAFPITKDPNDRTQELRFSGGTKF